MSQDIRHQEELLQRLVDQEQSKMKQMLGFSEVWIPSPEAIAKCNLFFSPNWHQCQRLLLIIVSGRGIQPGIWSRSMVLEAYYYQQQLQEQQPHLAHHLPQHLAGSMLPCLQEAGSQGYGVIVMNPNINTSIDQSTGEKIPIPNSATPEAHVKYVWETFATQNRSAQISIVAYGRGGVLAKYLVATQPDLCNRLAAIAFIESSHRISTEDPEGIRNLIGTRAINWKRSEEPPGTQLPDSGQLGCLSLSAGCPQGKQTSSNTAWTIGASLTTIFAFFASAHGTAAPPPDASMTGSSSFDSVDDAEMIEYSGEDGRKSKNMVISTSMSVTDFDLLSVVGKGAYGKVFLAKKKAGRNKGRVYAMKVLRKTDVFKKKQVEHTKSEQRILKHVEHPYVVRLRYAFQSDHKLYLVTDYYPGGSLFVHLRRSKQFPENRAKFYAAQLLLAIGHLHSMHIMYRDLKLENILMDGQGNIAITDFGLSKEDDEGSTFVGTPEYLAPELLSSQRTSSSYGNSVDWWSYGVLVYEMIRGQTPFWDKNRRQMFQNILTGEPFFQPELFSPTARSFLSALLVKNPQQRLGCGEKGPTELMEHPWFAGLDWHALLAKQIQPPFSPNVEGGMNYVPSVFAQQSAADSPVNDSSLQSGPGLQTMHFDGFSYMGSMGSRRTSIFRDSDIRMELDDMNDSMSFENRPW